MPEITLVTAAYRVSDEQIMNFLDWNQEVFVGNGVKVVIVTDRELSFLPNVVGRCVVYPKLQTKFSIGRTVNYGIRRVEGADDHIIAKTDIDIIFSDASVKHVKNSVCPGTGMTCFFSWVDSPSAAVTKGWIFMEKCYTGFGACFALTKADWWKIKGYDERIWGWGADDDEVLRRASESVHMLKDNTCPVFHIRHRQRKSFTQDAYFPDRAEENLKMTGWSDDGWGQAHQEEDSGSCNYPYRQDHGCVVMFGDMVEWNEHLEFLGALAYAKRTFGVSLKGLILAGSASSDSYVDKVRAKAKELGVDVEIRFVKAAIQPSGDGKLLGAVQDLGIPLIARLTDASGACIEHEKNGYVYGHPTWAGQWLDTLLKRERKP